MQIIANESQRMAHMIDTSLSNPAERADKQEVVRRPASRQSREIIATMQPVAKKNASVWSSPANIRLSPPTRA